MSSNPGGNQEKREFCRVCGRFATGVTVATVLDAAGSPHGITVNSFTSVSLEPPLVLICISHRAAVIEHFRNASHFGINVLRADQQHLSEQFARKGRDRFNGLPWRRGEHGVPLIPHCIATIECGVHKIIPAGDHDIFLGRVCHTHCSEGEPLLYYASGYGSLAR